MTTRLPLRGRVAGPTGPVRSDDERTRRRFRRRQWRRRWHVWRLIALAALGTGLLLGAGWAVYFSPMLVARSVEVRGTELLTAAQVDAAARLRLGEPLVQVDLDAVDARVEALAPVRSAEVTRIWPDTVLVEVTERRAVAVVEIGGRIRGMDESGVLFRGYRSAPSGLPRIRTELTVDTDTLHEAGQVLAALPPEVSRLVSYVSVETIDRISLVLRDDRVVLWGSAEESVDKGRVVGKLLAIPARRYDVSVPGLPTYRD
ncbi:MAG: cell division protein FtsQ/DivIB [Nocardioides sp.]